VAGERLRGGGERGKVVGKEGEDSWEYGKKQAGGVGAGERIPSSRSSLFYGFPVFLFTNP
jgi:hypothetical protein